MPFNLKNPPSDLKKKIKKRHPNAGAKEIRQFMHIFNSVLKNTNSEAAAFSQAWGQLNSNKKLESSSRETDPAQTKKDVKKWNKKNKVKKPKKKKKSNLLSYLVKLADELDSKGLLEEADLIDSIMSRVTEDL